MNNDSLVHLDGEDLVPLNDDDHALLDAIVEAQEAFDPLPAGLLERVEFAISLERLNAELATLTADELVATRSDVQVSTDTITFTASSISLMIVLTPHGDRVRIDGWVTGGGVSVTLHTGAAAHRQVSDATGRLVWPEVAHGPVRFLVESDLPGARPVVTPTIEV
ncbi:hypothetical protein ACPCG0_04245 [Propionibacteriaceae bacterium Y1923]|uniref:hypothetical protein n=1 Tax=Aestuariimicrobium sp. Y1814 TaxID=3418742 RepID=UPI003C2824BF